MKSKAVMAYVVQQTIGDLKEGSIIHIDQEKAQALVEAGVLAEASEDDVNGDMDEGEDAQESPMENAAITRALDKLSEKVVAKLSKSKVNTPTITVPAEVKQPAIKRLGELVYHNWRADKCNDPRSKAILRAHQEEMRIKSPLGANEGTQSQGGYDVKPEWFNTVFEKVHEYPDLKGRTVVVPAGSSTFNIPAINETGAADGSRHGGVLGYFVGEGATANSSYPALTQVTATLKTLVVLQYVTLQLLQDANIEAIEQLTGRQSALEIVWQTNDTIINGGGSSNGLGILNQPSLVTVTSSSHDSAHMFGFDDLANMYKALYPASRNNSVFIMNPEAYAILLQMTFPNAASTSVYPAWSLQYNAHEEFPLRLFGRPVIECLNNPQLGLAGDIILADLSQMVVYERAGIQADISDQLQFATLQLAYRWVYRFDVRSPWTSTYTSKDGAYSYSPFVCLASRGT